MRKKKGIIRYNKFTKGLAFCLAVISLSLVLAGGVASIWMLNAGIYTKSEELIREDVFYDIGYSVARDMARTYTKYGKEELSRQYDNKSFRYEFSCDDYAERYSANKAELLWTGQYSIPSSHGFDDGRWFDVSLYLPKDRISNPQYNDNFAQAYQLLNMTMKYRHLIPIYTLLLLGVSVVLIVYLLKAAGRKPMSEEIKVGFFAKLSLEVYITLVAAIEITLGALAIGLLDMSYDGEILVAWLFEGILIVGILAILLGFCMNLAVRAKIHTFWKNTLIYKGWMQVRRLFGALYRLFVSLPLIWKSVIAISGICILEFLIMMYCFANWGLQRELLIFFWFAEKAVLLPILYYIIICMKKLKKAGKSLAEGNLEYQVETNKMFWDLKEHGEDLNRIGEGIGHAVEERLKSERFKTELITNVSHDIKTPLTSIINYADLICKEETENEKIMEYSEVLYRQSGRLKKLIEDLVDASKASTGSVEVQLEPCQIGVLLEQVAGEFEARLLEKDIDLIMKVPEESMEIMADGRHLWRVFDNLMNNICKYAQNKTRVYLSVEKKDLKAVITFKNISEYPLDLTTEELMERFVRGDKSRHTEGNGLGLSIARSLTELQGGELELVVDGDLFKVLLTFPLIRK